MSILHKSIYIFCNFCKSCYPLNQRHLKVYKYLSYIKYVRSSILWSTVTKAASYGNYTAPAPPVVHYSAFPLIALSLLLPLLFSSFSLSSLLLFSSHSSSRLFRLFLLLLSSLPPPDSTSQDDSSRLPTSFLPTRSVCPRQSWTGLIGGLRTAYTYLSSILPVFR